MKVANQSLLIGLLIASVVLLSACNRESGSDSTGSDPLASRTSVMDDQFGKEFGEAHRASPNSEPREISKDDLPPVSYTDEPVAIN